MNEEHDPADVSERVREHQPLHLCVTVLPVSGKIRGDDRVRELPHMTGRVVRLVTFVDLDEDNARTGSLSFSAVLSAVLEDGRRVVLLSDRGWTQSTIVFSKPRLPGAVLSAFRQRQRWQSVTAQSVEANARSVVGPDEPYGEYGEAETTEAHWSYLAGVLEEAGISTAPTDLSSLPHDVELSQRLEVRIASESAR